MKGCSVETRQVCWSVGRFWQTVHWAGNMNTVGIWLHPWSRSKLGHQVWAFPNTVCQLLWLYPKEKLNFCSDLFPPTLVIILYPSWGVLKRSVIMFHLLVTTSFLFHPSTNCPRLLLVGNCACMVTHPAAHPDSLILGLHCVQELLPARGGRHPALAVSTPDTASFPIPWRPADLPVIGLLEEVGLRLGCWWGWN